MLAPLSHHTAAGLIAGEPTLRVSVKNTLLRSDKTSRRRATVIIIIVDETDVFDQRATHALEGAEQSQGGKVVSETGL